MEMTPQRVCQWLSMRCRVGGLEDILGLKATVDFCFFFPFYPPHRTPQPLHQLRHQHYLVLSYLYIMGRGKGNGFPETQCTWLLKRVPEYLSKTAHGKSVTNGSKASDDHDLAVWVKDRLKEFELEFQDELDASVNGVKVMRDISLIIIFYLFHLLTYLSAILYFFSEQEGSTSYCQQQGNRFNLNLYRILSNSTLSITFSDVKSQTFVVGTAERLTSYGSIPF